MFFGSTCSGKYDIQFTKSKLQLTNGTSGNNFGQLKMCSFDKNEGLKNVWFLYLVTSMNSYTRVYTLFFMSRLFNRADQFIIGPSWWFEKCRSCYSRNKGNFSNIWFYCLILSCIIVIFLTWLFIYFFRLHMIVKTQRNLNRHDFKPFSELQVHQECGFLQI